MEIYSYYNKNLGPKSQSAGLRVQFIENRGEPGIHYKTDVGHEYRAAIVKGLEDGLAIRFPDSRHTASITIEASDEHPIDSCPNAFYLTARCIIEQAYVLSHITLEDSKSQR